MKRSNIVIIRRPDRVPKRRRVAPPNPSQSTVDGNSSTVPPINDESRSTTVAPSTSTCTAGNNVTDHLETKSIITHHLDMDCWSQVILFCPTRTWLQLSYTCQCLNSFKFVKCLMLNKKRSLKTSCALSAEEINKSLEAARGTLFYVRFTGRNRNMITDESLTHLRGTIFRLNISHCTELKDDSFANLSGINRLTMIGCRVTDRAISHLTGICHLNMSSCTRITDRAFSFLTGIHWLSMNGCYQRSITDRAFSYLTGIHTLSIKGCSQRTITDQAFSYLKSVRVLNMEESSRNITDHAFSYLTELTSLNMNGCTQRTITDQAFSYIIKVKNISMANCCQLTITNNAFSKLTRLKTIDLTGCRQLTITEQEINNMIHQTQSQIKPQTSDEEANTHQVSN